ncbi:MULTISPECIES: rhodanese-like domain-containing protein [unclassified Bacillus (in: firmicutes)]|uniref:rhodanese-like domain-containing protein n=1 Tax=unclassified Bacillus (in: firmicutes) TaxID=185979 RepID=UPI0008F03303|nr:MULTISPECIES: rhodanese-like domain-containing protein [unclassified Bacillus (in: firmicutes)]SFA78186.1 Rhodanese-related sulfurtransferase [Bacillus sp. UNCCL13]SFQ68108.1 Rhodanese-related sulfurtransferase [Bacillus sp. cl95]
MEYLNYVVIGIFVLFMLQRLLPTKGVKQISTSALKNELNDQNKQFVDVRTPVEFKGNHIRGFKNIPLHQLANNVNELSKEKEIVVICQSGMRSNKASKLLKKKGFKQVTNVKGGISAW